ncbi:hypothetical protein [Sphingobium yanoikuyae]|uniref:hypothetical protein n=1 Tax=Sphingobium yanoikuyae TaxID=13690 RepID=UPI000262C3B9|nr:hypothetical protein [Sphingobium yanoikuyae]
MGKVIRFPVERTRPHVLLTWDWAFDEYRIQPHGPGFGADAIEFCSSYDEAWDRFISMGERHSLPLIDCTPEGRAA